MHRVCTIAGGKRHGCQHCQCSRGQGQITHVETNQVRETLTNTDGTYTFPTIPPGTYEVEISRKVSRPSHAKHPRHHQHDGACGRLSGRWRRDAVGGSDGPGGAAADRRRIVRSEFTTNSLSNLPLPPGRNYELLYVTIPGFQPPSQFGPLPTNPSRVTASTVNGASAMTPV